MSHDVFNTPGAHSWTCPTNVTAIRVVIRGGGAGGYSPSPWTGGAGGGGGACSDSDRIVVPGQVYSLFVGAGGLPNADGQVSWFDSEATAKGDSGRSSQWYGPTGYTSVGTRTAIGGGGNGPVGNAGGPGGGAGGEDYKNGDYQTAGGTLFPGGAGGNAGQPGVAPGGGGGGGTKDGTPAAAGAAGSVIIVY